MSGINDEGYTVAIVGICNVIIENKSGSEMINVRLHHKYSNISGESLEWGKIDKNNTTTRDEKHTVEFHSGCCTTGRDWWRLTWYDENNNWYSTCPKNCRGPVETVKLILRGGALVSFLYLLSAAFFKGIGFDKIGGQRVAVGMLASLLIFFLNSGSTFGYKQHILGEDDINGEIKFTVYDSKKIEIQSKSSENCCYKFFCRYTGTSSTDYKQYSFDDSKIEEKYKAKEGLKEKVYKLEKRLNDLKDKMEKGLKKLKFGLVELEYKEGLLKLKELKFEIVELEYKEGLLKYGLKDISLGLKREIKDRKKQIISGQKLEYKEGLLKYGLKGISLRLKSEIKYRKKQIISGQKLEYKEGLLKYGLKGISLRLKSEIKYRKKQIISGQKNDSKAGEYGTSNPIKNNKSNTNYEHAC